MCLYVSAQNKLQLSIKKATGKIVVDGFPDEADWLSADVAKDFFQNYPFDSSFAITKTEARVTYDDIFFYISAVCYDDLEGDYVIQSLKRDFSYPINDAFAVYIDPFNDKTNGFNFTVNPLGVQREGLLSNGGGFGVSTDWDNKWYCKTQKGHKKWTVEMAIPFKTLRYSSTINTWGINFSRNDLKRNENSSWGPVPRNFNVGTLAFTGKLIWDAAPKKAGSNISVIPYGIFSVSEDYIADSVMRYKPNGGVDAKVGITSSLNLDITVNPDFSQVEVDNQVTNLTRFSIFFPERRNFFIENSDLFDRFGFRQIRPFFSRNIGLKNGTIIPIYAGARLSGRINQNWRIGVMNMQTSAKDALGINSENFIVAALQRNVFKRSNIAAIFVNRQGFKNKEYIVNDYNRIAGLDFNLATTNNRLIGKAFYHYSFNTISTKNNYAHASFLRYDNGFLALDWNHEYVGENYFADVGFVPRVNLFNPETGLYRNSYWRLEDNVSYFFFPKNSAVNKHGPMIAYSHYLDDNFKNNELLLTYQYQIKFLNTDQLDFYVYNHAVKLTQLTDVSFYGNDDTLPAATYKYTNAEIAYKMNERRKFFGTAKINYGEYFTGNKITYSVDFSYRTQPWGVFTLSASRDEIYMPSPLPNASITLIRTKVELLFSKNLFFTTFAQYNTQANNFNINSRLQWRFKPMSDLYIVYTDNYASTDFTKKNKALVVKLIYWFSI